MPAKYIVVLLPIIALLPLVGCTPAPSTPPGESAQTAAVPEKGGAELWAENCSRCHNFRPPQSFSEAQWHAVVHHMRLRANLTGQEAREITAFLQASNQQ